MDEIAEFVDGHMDGQTITVRDPAPNVIRVPVPTNTLADVLNEDDPYPSKLSFVVEDYRLVGRNDAGHLRYSKSSRG